MEDAALEKLIKKMDESIGRSVEVHVNGKIKAIDKKLDDYIMSDNAWKEEADPYIKGLANVSGAAKIIVWIAVGSTAIIGLVKQFLK